MSRRALPFLLYALLLHVSNAWCALDVYLKLEGIEGDSNAEAHPKWIRLYSFSHRIALPASPSNPPMHQAPQHSGIRLQKALDVASVPLLRACGAGTAIPKATIEFLRLVERAPRLYRIELQNVRVTRVTTDLGCCGSAGDEETVELAYDTIHWIYTPYSRAGTPPPDVEAWWSPLLGQGGEGPPEPDNDGDGTPDHQDKDDDNDGMPDAYERQYGLNPWVNDAGGDLDGDGMPNGSEHAAGTAPNDPASLLRITSAGISSDGRLRISWMGVPGKIYELHRSTRPEGPYVMHSQAVSVVPGLMTLNLPLSEATLFFRLVPK